jgi:exosortase A
MASAPALPSPRGFLTDTGWTGHLSMLGLAALAVLALFWRDAADMPRIWWEASTYNHCMLIPFIVGWLVMQRKDEVAQLTPSVWLPGLFCVAGGGLIWSLGQASGIALFRHAGLVLMLQSLVLTLLGRDVTKGLLFPLFYLSFMVPAGEELVPYLQTITAKMCMIILAILQVPAHIEGIFITTPNGYFEVAEACSGVKFLVAMVAYGTLVANVCFKSWPRRAAFMALSVLIPILANGMRAAGTIYVAYLTTPSAAEGFDHVIYGWFFFAFVMALTMAIGWRFFDRKIDDPWIGSLGTDHTPSAQPAMLRTPVLASVLAIGLATIPIAWNAQSETLGRIAMPNRIDLPPIKGWARVPINDAAWSPHYKGTDHQLLGRYRNASGQTVDLAIVLFAWQEEQRELAGFEQGAASPEGGAWIWSSYGKPLRGGKFEQIVGSGPTTREVVTFYRLNKVTTGDAGQVKLETLKARLTGGDQAAAAVLVSAVDRKDAPARAAMDAFLGDLGDPGALADMLIGQARGTQVAGVSP